MAAELPEAGIVALCIAAGCAKILKPLLHFLEGSPARGPALDAAVLFVGLTIVLSYLAGVVLLYYLHVTLAAGTPVVLAAFRLFLLFVCALLLFVASFLRLLPRRRRQ